MSTDLTLPYDNIYQLPDYVECFVDRANQELRDYWGWYVRPWTSNRCVTLFYKGNAVTFYTYDILKVRMVACLDSAVAKAIAERQRIEETSKNDSIIH